MLHNKQCTNEDYNVVTHLDLLKSVGSVCILKYVSISAMLKLLKKGKVND